MTRLRIPGIIPALVAALVVVLAAWFLPLHDIISGEEQLAPERVPEARQAVSDSRQAFEQARDTYQAYIKSHDVSALHDQLMQAVTTARADPSNQGKLAAVHDLAGQLTDYGQVLLAYSQANDRYLNSLRSYDDNLMSWTRGLFAASESLRSETWPFVEHLKLYPEPIGLKTDPPMVTAAPVAQQIESLRSHTTALSGAGDPGAALDGIARDLGDIWASGRSVEYVAGLNEEYNSELTVYDGKVQVAAASPEATAQGARRQVVAVGLDVLVGLITFAGLAALFLPGRKVAR